MNTYIATFYLNDHAIMRIMNSNLDKLIAASMYLLETEYSGAKADITLNNHRDIVQRIRKSAIE